jgi:hypothetical protein
MTGLVLGAGQRDVGQAQVLAALLGLVLGLVARELRSVEADVDRPRVARVGVVEEDRLLAARDVAGLPQVREVDDGELEPLAAVDRQDLHRLLVGVQAAAALLVARLVLRGGDPLAQPGGQRGRAHVLGRRRGVQQLGDVAQVGQPALAVDARQDAARAGPRRA